MDDYERTRAAFILFAMFVMFFLGYMLGSAVGGPL